ncbi:MAG: hypothetical protein Tsb0015_10050 [Simkaniaceae bacterium]
MDVLQANKIYYSRSLEETKRIGKDIAKDIVSGDILCFYGGLGAGKTTLIKAILTNLNPQISENDISSPTFNYIHTYEGKFPIHHFDLYRLENEKDFFSLGFEEFLEEGAVFIEWPDRIENILPDPIFRIDLCIIGEQSRKITCRRSHGKASF